MNKYVLANPLSVLLDKPKEEFTRDDLLKIIEMKELERITFHYTALDGKLKELKIPLPSRRDAEIILTEGERVDGSSLFKGMVDPGISDLYIVPIYKSAFINPFDSGSLDFVCRYLSRDGYLAPFTPDNILLKAYELFKKDTGMEILALGELEFYLFWNYNTPLYMMPPQGGYQASSPWYKAGKVLSEILKNITQITSAVKYVHSEVGFIKCIESGYEEINGKTGEQCEVELLPAPIDETADNIVLAKWLIRNIAFQNGMLATFAPKLEDGYAGNGMHVHVRITKDGKNALVDSSGVLTETAKRLIGGLCHYANTLTAFGNTVTSSYMRLVPDQEAPTKVCWSDSNRSVLIRVPLGWAAVHNLAKVVNPESAFTPFEHENMQTIELRTPDGSANAHLLLAGITMAADWGLTNDRALQIANELYVKGNITDNPELLKKLPSLPKTCYESAEMLNSKRNHYERENVFLPSVIDYIIDMLKSQNDKDLHKKLADLFGRNKTKEIKYLLHKDLHKH